MLNYKWNDASLDTSEQDNETILQTGFFYRLEQAYYDGGVENC